MTILKNVGMFIGWLAGSLAGVMACLYAFGYVITQVNLNLLGLDLYLFTFDPPFYLIRGATFALYLALYVVVISVVLLPLAGLALFIRSRIARRLATPGEDGRMARLWRRVAAHPHLLHGFGFACLLLLLIGLLRWDGWAWWHWGQSPALVDVLRVRNLLHGPVGADSALLDLFANGDSARLSGYFVQAVRGLLIGALLLYGAWRWSAAFRLRYLMRAPFVLVFVVYGVLAPLTYGVVRVPNEFSRIEILGVENPRGAAPDTFFLLNKTDEAFLLWDALERSVLWVPVGAVRSARVGKRANVTEIRSLTAAGEP